MFGYFLFYYQIIKTSDAQFLANFSHVDIPKIGENWDRARFLSWNLLKICWICVFRTSTFNTAPRRGSEWICQELSSTAREAIWAADGTEKEISRFLLFIFFKLFYSINRNSCYRCLFLESKRHPCFYLHFAYFVHDVRKVAGT